MKFVVELRRFGLTVVERSKGGESVRGYKFAVDRTTALELGTLA
jgi:hypothetical protein